MKNIYNYIIVISFIGLWLTSFLTGTLEIVLGFILIFSFGIIHGSNDLLLINAISKPELRESFIKILTKYLLVVIVAVAVFYVMPFFALILFIVFSAFHFGEQHWEHQILAFPKLLANAFYFVYGLFVLQLLFILNVSEIIEIIEAITNYKFDESAFQYIFIGTSIALIVLSVMLFLKYNDFKSVLLRELFYVMVFGIIFKASTLIWGFTIYFIFWHSVPSLITQVGFIYGDFNKKTVLKYVTRALPFWIISLLGIGVLYLFFKDHTIFYAIFFPCIAAVTFPHAIVINLMFSKQKPQEGLSN